MDQRLLKVSINKRIGDFSKFETTLLATYQSLKPSRLATSQSLKQVDQRLLKVSINKRIGDFSKFETTLLATSQSLKPSRLATSQSLKQVDQRLLKVSINKRIGDFSTSMAKTCEGKETRKRERMRSFHRSSMTELSPPPPPAQTHPERRRCPFPTSQYCVSAVESLYRNSHSRKKAAKERNHRKFGYIQHPNARKRRKYRGFRKSQTPGIANTRNNGDTGAKGTSGVGNAEKNYANGMSVLRVYVMLAPITSDGNGLPKASA